MAKGALATTAIEGNTLTEEEVQKRIRGDLILPPSKEYLGKEIDNVIKAYNEIGKQQLNEANDNFTAEDIKRYNQLVLTDLPLSEEVIPGVVRNYSVGIASYRGAPPQDCEYLLERYVNGLNNDFKNIPENLEMIYGLLKAILAHLYFVWIHPFGDGNGRTARLIEFRILLSVGVPAVAAHLMSNHYNITRSEYYRNLELSSKSVPNVVVFINYALQGFVDGLKQQLDNVRGQQYLVHFVNHIHREFKNKDRSEEIRRRKLMLEFLEKDKDKIKLPDVRHITPKTAEMYASLTDKTVSRDIDKLIKMGLLIKSRGGFIEINWGLIQAFLTPVRKKLTEK